MRWTMGICGFVDELNRLRKSSSDSIDNVVNFDSFKKYMHIQRQAEVDLKDILRKVNGSGKKTIILLCGSAGDGKSHLLSYLKNSDDEYLLENYEIHNDATESSSPAKTAIETLNEVLDSFSDEQIDKDGKNLILAINLGVLSNFIESDYGIRFSKLKKYVLEYNLLTSKVNLEGYIPGSSFQHISFADYHMFTLSEDGIRARYIELILDKIFSKNEDSVFYSTYLGGLESCPLAKKCPVKNNFEFLLKSENRRFVSELLAKAIIQDKEVLTTREILNYVYDILVSSNFSYQDLQNATINNAAYLKLYLSNITPTLMFGQNDVSLLMNVLKKYDPVLIRSEQADEEAIDYYVSSKVCTDIVDGISNTAYADVINQKDMITTLSNDKELKAIVFNTLVRLKKFNRESLRDDIYIEFLKDLYYYNSGKIEKLQSLYSKVENAVYQWCGNEMDGNICLDDTHEGFTLYESLEFDECLDNIPDKNNDKELNKFLPTIVVEFNSGDDKPVALEIDFSLYSIICKLNKGYVQTADDRNNHADFISFINKILKTGTVGKSVISVSEQGIKANIEKTKFGYRFKVVR